MPLWRILCSPSPSLCREGSRQNRQPPQEDIRIKNKRAVTAQPLPLPTIILSYQSYQIVPNRTKSFQIVPNRPKSYIFSQKIKKRCISAALSVQYLL
nr:MAG TPA: hypothetical protein [Caudoviricetes sp.]